MKATYGTPRTSILTILYKLASYLMKTQVYIITIPINYGKNTAASI